MNRKAIKYGICAGAGVLAIGIILVAIAMSSFNLFTAPDQRQISTECDYEGIRQAAIYQVDGNAVTNESIHVSINMGCEGSNYDKEGRIIFSADNTTGKGDILLKWLSFNTLSINYWKGLRVINHLDKVEFQDTTLNVQVKYKTWE